MIVVGLLILAASAGLTEASGNAATETIVFLRHGEKPEAGLGQLSCQGLNRALALPPVLTRLFGRPAAIFAPNPSRRKDDGGTSYDYVRPLATIEPTAIDLGMPVDTSFGYDDIAGLKAALAAPDLRDKLVFVAWEHKQIVDLARELMSENAGDPKSIPKWHGKDFDALYVLRVTRNAGAATVAFERLAEGLDGQSQACARPTK
ncbi:MAG: hypothetical protein KGI75_23965 [Rhizobiaceae bacterium]|nr:hypothetical protein [Rhizobiaceae bacterium]